MPGFGSLGKFFGKTVSEGAAFAAGVAVAPTLEPVVEEVRQEAWAKAHNKRVDTGAAAAIVAEDVEEQPWGAAEALHHGIDGARFDALVREARNAPGFAELVAILRRHPDQLALFEHGLRKAKLETRWDAALEDLQHNRISVEKLGDLIQRGLVAPPFDLPYDPPGAGGTIPAFPPAKIDAATEARDTGYTKERLYAETALAGNPPGPSALYRARFRGAINDVDVTRGLAEGRSRQEWGPAFEADARAIPSPANYVEGFVRDWIGRGEMEAGAERNGMSAEDANLLYLIHGRPLSWHQVWIGLARGGVYNGPTDDIDPAFLKALRESDIRPEWYALAWAQRYSYPAAFVLRALAQAGDLTEAETDEILRFQGWEPGLAANVSKRWATARTSAAKEASAADLLALYDGGRATEAQTLAALEDLGYPADEAQRKIDTLAARRVASAKGTAITDIHAKYKRLEIDADVAVAAVTNLGVPPWAATAIVQAWAFAVTATEPT